MWRWWVKWGVWRRDSEGTEPFLVGDFCGDFHGFRSWFWLGYCWVICLIVYIYYVSYVDGYGVVE